MYEKMRSAVMLEMAKNGIDSDMMKTFLNIIDKVAEKFIVSEQCTDLVVRGRDKLEECRNLYLVCKKIEGCSDETIKNYRYTIDNFIEETVCSIEKIDANVMRRYLAKYKTSHGIDNRSLDKIRQSLKAWFTWMQEEGYIQKNPLANVAKVKFNVKRKESLTQNELEKLRDTCRNDQERALVEVLYSTGGRITEVLNIKVADINFNLPLPECEVLGKGGVYGKVYFSPRSVSCIKKYLKTRKHNSEYLFNNERGGGQMKRHNAEKIFRRLRKEAGLEGKSLTPHTMRHTTATTAIKVAPVEVVRDMLRHKNINTTMVYADVSPDDVKRYHERLIV